MSVETTIAPVRANQHGEHQADGPLSQNRDDIVRLRIHLNHGFQAGIDRLDEAGAVEGNAVRNFLDAASDDPIHDANILRKAAAGGLEARSHANFLVYRDTGHRVSGRSKNNSQHGMWWNAIDPIAGLVARRRPSPTAATTPAVS